MSVSSNSIGALELMYADEEETCKGTGLSLKQSGKESEKSVEHDKRVEDKVVDNQSSEEVCNSDIINIREKMSKVFNDMKATRPVRTKKSQKLKTPDKSNETIDDNVSEVSVPFTDEELVEAYDELYSMIDYDPFFDIFDDSSDYGNGNLENEDTSEEVPKVKELVYPYGNIIPGERECEICLEVGSRRRYRKCCGICFCDDCMESYFVCQVENGIIRIECISDKCRQFAHVEEIMGRLPDHMKNKYYTYLINANNDPHVKTCPRCSFVQHVSREEMRSRKKKVRNK